MRLHDVTFEGQSFPANRLHIQQLSEGVYELTGPADRVGNWRLALQDAADGYYGLGERLNELRHTHQVIRNGSTSVKCQSRLTTNLRGANALLRSLF